MPPSKPKPWPGIRSSMQYGPVCPQAERTGWANDEEAFMFEWDDGQQGEDCLRVNVWTPGVGGNAKRPVMVWLHGGGMTAGSGQELKAYDGENLARRGDVVVVSLNHRLNVLGYLNLSASGPKFSSSMNAGMLDIVLALEWVRDNIANFGGDPGKVMIFGQSGGGAKVSTLMAMPSAKGLFHRAAVESGSSLRAISADYSLKLAAATLAELGMSANQAEMLAGVPYPRLLAAASTAQRKLGSAGAPGRIAPLRVSDRTGLGAVVDGKILPNHPFDPKAPDISSGVPMIVGTCLNEFMSGINRPDIGAMTEDEAKKPVIAAFGAKADAIWDAHRKAHPGAKPWQVQSLIGAAGVRFNATIQAERKAALGAAPAYLFWFTWQTPIFDGRPGAFHCAELPHVFYNADRCAAMTGGTPEARALSARMSDAWIQFARSGDPNHKGIPSWPAYNAGKGPVMIFDNRCEVKDDPDRAERRMMQESQP
jgi:para-nitrobenzyl esterase